MVRIDIFIWGMLHAIYYQLSSIRIDNRFKRHFMRLPQKGKEMFGILNTFCSDYCLDIFRAPTISEALDYVRLLFLKVGFLIYMFLHQRLSSHITIVLLIGFIIFEWCSRNKGISSRTFNVQLESTMVNLLYRLPSHNYIRLLW